MIKRVKNILIFVIVIVLCITGFFWVNNSPLDEKVWQSRQNFYKIGQKQVGEYQDLKNDWNNSTRLLDIFIELEEEKNAFICSTWNYDIIEGVPRYELNEDSSIPIEYDYYGYSFITTQNYFDYTSIKNIEGKNIQELLTNDENTLDILVPESYKKDEQLIIQSYQDFMFFNNVEVGNFYQEEFKKDLITKKPSDFHINIIYVPTKTKYNVYNPYIEKDYINDCIAVVVNSKNYHRCQLNALLSQGLYICSENMDLEDQVFQVYKQNNFEDGYHSLEKVSDRFAQYKSDLLTKNIVIGILFVIVMICGALCVWVIRKIYKKKVVNQQL